MHKSHAVINGLCLITLLLSLVLQKSTFSAYLILGCLLAAVGVLFADLGRLSNVSEDNPKMKTLRFATVFSVVFVLVIVFLASLFEHGHIAPTEQNAKFFLCAVECVLMLVFGNLAPKLPFNRYTGLRLPWTVRDEQTWLIAHRILGYLSFPLAVLCLAGLGVDLPLDLWTKVFFVGGLMVWIGVPGVISGAFFWRKYRG